MGNAQTFSIGFDDPTYNETQWSERVAQHLGVDHHVEIIRPDVLGLFDKLMSHMDDPIADVSIFPTYLVSKLAAAHVKVALSGDGGDELFGGYETYPGTGESAPMERSARVAAAAAFWRRSRRLCRPRRPKKASSIRPSDSWKARA